MMIKYSSYYIYLEKIVSGRPNGHIFYYFIILFMIYYYESDFPLKFIVVLTCLPPHPPKNLIV